MDGKLLPQMGSMMSVKIVFLCKSLLAQLALVWP